MKNQLKVTAGRSFRTLPPLWLALGDYRFDIVESIFACPPNYHRLALEIIITSKNEDMLERHHDKITKDNYGYLLGKASEVDNVFAVNLIYAKFSEGANSDRAENAGKNNALSYCGFAGIIFRSSVQSGDEIFCSTAQIDDETLCHADKRPRADFAHKKRAELK